MASATVVMVTMGEVRSHDFVNGSVNMNIYGVVNLPFSFTLSDFGGRYSYPIPSNRFSIHPSYKWVTGHIGDIAMTFSPYTLNGYLFRGVGADLEPEGAFKGSVIYGRLQKAVEYDTANSTVPAAYERMGFGTRLQLQEGEVPYGPDPVPCVGRSELRHQQTG